MRSAAIILLLFLATTVFAQQKQVSFYEIDERVKSIDPAPPAQLAYTLTKDYTTDREKLRSIFSWITEHISYRVRKNRNGIPLSNNATHHMVIDSARWQSANDMVANLVLQTGSAVCDGYARLFKTLCDYAGLQSAIVSGFAKGDYSRQSKFRCNHTWNAVYVDSAWQLLDVTWASGYTSYSGDEFYKKHDETYFLPSPENFMQDHFPDDLRWCLIDNPNVPREFGVAPYRSRAFTKYRLNGYAPESGIIDAAIGDTIKIVLSTTDPVADSKMAPDTVTAFDISLQKIISSVGFASPSVADNNKQLLHYTYYVEDSNVQWLHVVYNHDTVLRYRLRIKKEKPALASNGITLPFESPLP